MDINKSGETFIGIIIGMVILTFISLGIIHIIGFNKDIISEYELKTHESIITQNTNNVFNKINLSNLSDQETFYIYKNKETKNFEVYTGSENESYKYIDYLGDNISDISNFDGEVFKRDMSIEKNNINNIEVNSLNLKIKNITLSN